MRKLGIEKWLIRSVMAMYKHARTRARPYCGSVSEWFGVNVGVYQGSVLSPLLFKINPLSLKINEEKTKVMCESFGTGTTQIIGNVKHPCSVCLKGVGVNSIRCTQCIQWVHARCSRVKGSLKKVESSFICRRCKGELIKTRQVNSQVNGLHIDGHEYEIVDKFCYLGDMLSQEGGCEHAILKRIQTGWLKFRELSGLFIGKGMSLRAKGIIYTTCIRPAMLYGSETWPTKIEDIRKIQRSEMRMLRWMTGVSLSERKSNECVRSMLEIDDIVEVM